MDMDRGVLNRSWMARHNADIAVGHNAAGEAMLVKPSALVEPGRLVSSDRHLARPQPDQLGQTIDNNPDDITAEKRDRQVGEEIHRDRLQTDCKRLSGSCSGCSKPSGFGRTALTRWQETQQSVPLLDILGHASPTVQLVRLSQGAPHVHARMPQVGLSVGALETFASKSASVRDRHLIVPSPHQTIRVGDGTGSFGLR